MGKVDKKVRSTEKAAMSYPIGDEFRQALERELPPGERLVNMCNASPNGEFIFSDSIFFGRALVPSSMRGIWWVLALTNVNVRYFSWELSEPRQVGGNWISGKLWASDVLPQIDGMTSLAIREIWGLNRERFSLENKLRSRYLKRLGVDIGQVECLSFNCSHGEVEFFSHEPEMKALVSNLDSMLVGNAVASQVANTADALSRLAELRTEGLLNDQEFERAKAGFVGASTEVGESVVSILRQLHGLYVSGVLTESEFRQKKWDLLSRQP